MYAFSVDLCDESVSPSLLQLECHLCKPNPASLEICIAVSFSDCTLDMLFSPVLDCNRTRTHNHLNRKKTPNHLAKLAIHRRTSHLLFVWLLYFSFETRLFINKIFLNISNKDLKTRVGSLIMIRFEQLRESSGSLKTINTPNHLNLYEVIT